VRVIDRNKKAAFWRRAVSEFVGEETEPMPFARDSQRWHLFSFESEGGAQQLPQLTALHFSGTLDCAQFEE
jgi:hypothetical protein